MPAPIESFTARFGRAAILLFAFGVVEAVLGSLVAHNPAMVADAGHNLSDSALLVVVFMLIEAVASRYAWSHLISCTGRRMTGMAACAITIGLIAVFTFTEASQNQHHLNPWLALPVGLASFVLNSRLGKGLESHDNANAHGSSIHLKVDAWMSIALIPGAFGAYWLHASWPNLIAAVVILAGATWHNGGEIWEMGRNIHRQENHAGDGEELHPHH